MVCNLKLIVRNKAEIRNMNVGLTTSKRPQQPSPENQLFLLIIVELVLIFLSNMQTTNLLQSQADAAMRIHDSYD